MIRLAGHKLKIVSRDELKRRGYRLAKRSTRLLPVTDADLVEGAEVCIEGNWYEIFMLDHVRDHFFLEPGEPSGN